VYRHKAFSRILLSHSITMVTITWDSFTLSHGNVNVPLVILRKPCWWGCSALNAELQFDSKEWRPYDRCGSSFLFVHLLDPNVSLFSIRNADGVNTLHLWSDNSRGLIDCEKSLFIEFDTDNVQNVVLRGRRNVKLKENAQRGQLSVYRTYKKRLLQINRCEQSAESLISFRLQQPAE
jgi:hypothetical protein